jgi:diguanylate cyclase (GGDEF)-like protein
VGKTLNVNDVCKKTLKVIVSVMSAEKCCIYLYNDETSKLEAAESFGWSAEEKKEKFEVDSEDPGLIMRAIKTEKVQSMNPEHENTAKAAFEVNAVKKIPSTMCAPLLLGEKKLGVLNIEKMEGSPGTEEIRLFYYIAMLTAMAIENSKLFMKTELLANFDGLTKMYTHRYMQDFLDRELEKSARYNHPLSLVLTDIDHFKPFNDVYGHQVGDMVLAETAKVLREAVRTIDIAARYGGEEFMIVLPETDYKGAYAFAERLRRNVEAKSYWNEGTKENLRVTISIGVSQFPLHHTEKAKLIEKADQAMYEAKETGRNKVKIAKISRDAMMKMQEEKNK